MPTTSNVPGIMDNKTRDELLAQAPSPLRVTPDYMKSRISDISFTDPDFDKGETFTICKITVDNGFVVFGESACVDPLNYRQDLGQKIAYDKAFEKLWPAFGFLFKELQYLGMTGLVIATGTTPEHPDAKGYDVGKSKRGE